MIGLVGEMPATSPGAAAAAAATCVPCPSSSGASGGVPAIASDAGSTRPASSGTDGSTPVSRTAIGPVVVGSLRARALVTAAVSSSGAVGVSTQVPPMYARSDRGVGLGAHDAGADRQRRRVVRRCDAERRLDGREPQAADPCNLTRTGRRRAPSVDATSTWGTGAAKAGGEGRPDSRSARSGRDQPQGHTPHVPHRHRHRTGIPAVAPTMRQVNVRFA